MALVPELKDDFEVLKPPSLIKQLEEGGRISQRDILSKTLTQSLLQAVYVKETWLQGHPQWTDSWTVNNTWTDITGATAVIDFYDHPDVEFYFEMIGKTDAGTAHYRIYNVTDSESLSGSEISTTSTTATRVRSDAIAKPTGEKELKLQHKIVGGDGSSEYVNSMMSRYVFRLPS